MFSLKKKPASISINLVPKDPFFSSNIGRALTWVLSAGRYLVIFTEIIVIFSFGTRFWLDRRVTDLNSNIYQKQVQIQAFEEVETRARIVQNKIEQYQQINQAANPVDIFPEVAQVIPAGINLDRLTIKDDKVSLSGSASSQVSFSTLVTNMQLSPYFFDITVPIVESGEKGSSGYLFDLSAKTKEVAELEKTPQIEEKQDILDRTQGL